MIALCLCTFMLGFAFNHFIATNQTQASKPRATGVGGIFFKCKNPKAVKDWYQKNLGFNIDKYGTNFQWYQGADSTKKGYTAWAPFAQTTKYFAPSEKDFMINYRVENMELLVQQMKQNGVNVVDSIQTVDYGKFVHVMDVEGNKVELWEPIDEVYSKIEGGVTN